MSLTAKYNYLDINAINPPSEFNRKFVRVPTNGAQTYSPGQTIQIFTTPQDLLEGPNSFLSFSLKTNALGDDPTTNPYSMNNNIDCIFRDVNIRTPQGTQIEFIRYYNHWVSFIYDLISSDANQSNWQQGIGTESDRKRWACYTIDYTTSLAGSGFLSNDALIPLKYISGSNSSSIELHLTLEDANRCMTKDLSSGDDDRSYTISNVEYHMSTVEMKPETRALMDGILNSTGLYYNFKAHSHFANTMTAQTQTISSPAIYKSLISMDYFFKITSQERDRALAWTSNRVYPEIDSTGVVAGGDQTYQIQIGNKYFPGYEIDFGRNAPVAYRYLLEAHGFVPNLQGTQISSYEYSGYKEPSLSTDKTRGFRFSIGQRFTSESDDGMMKVGYNTKTNSESTNLTVRLASYEKGPYTVFGFATYDATLVILPTRNMLEY